MKRPPPDHRNPLVISGNHLASGDRTTTFVSGDAHALLRSYLIFVRDLRGQRREPSIELRTDDVAVLATHLGVSETSVLGGLLDLMGATRSERHAALAMLAAGALTVVLSGSVVTGLTRDGISVEFDRLADAVHGAVVSGEPGTDRSAGADVGAAERVAAAASPPAHATTATPRPDVLRSAAAATASAVERGRGVSAAEPVATLAVEESAPVDSPAAAQVADSVAPAATEPAATDTTGAAATAELPDGTTVGVGTPPIPPAGHPTQPAATAELPDGTTVGVGTPPIPPTDEDSTTG